MAKIDYSKVLHTQGWFMVGDSSRNWQVCVSTSNIHGRSSFQGSNIRLQKFTLVTSLVASIVVSCWIVAFLYSEWCKILFQNPSTITCHQELIIPGDYLRLNSLQELRTDDRNMGLKHILTTLTTICNQNLNNFANHRKAHSGRDDRGCGSPICGTGIWKAMHMIVPHSTTAVKLLFVNTLCNWYIIQ